MIGEKDYTVAFSFEYIMTRGILNYREDDNHDISTSHLKNARAQAKQK